MKKNLNKNSEAISGMFNSIASKYDRMNHWMSLGTDKRWRRRFVKALSEKLKTDPPRVLDLACGTGDLTLAMARLGWIVTGLDISAEMMEVGKVKCADVKPRPDFVLGSAESIPFEDGTFDAVTIAFGLRNFDHRQQCLAEIRRVLKPGGRLAVLEFAVPKNPLWRAIYLLYFKNSMRIMGRLVGSSDAYRYLVDSVLAFPRYEALCREFEQAGFQNVSFTPFSGGIAVNYVGTVAKQAQDPKE